MIEIKKEIMIQIKKMNEKNPRYMAQILKRVPDEIRDVILMLRTAPISDLEAYAMFLFFMEDGLEKFSVKTDIPFNYLDEVERNNPDIHDFCIFCSFSQSDRFTVLVLLFRIYESEHEVRSLR